LNADIIIHLIDLSHPDHEAQEKSVDEILTELSPPNMLNNMIKIYNKIDRVKDLNDLMAKKESPNAYFVSCKTGYGVSDLKIIIEKKVYKKMNYIELKLKINQGSDEMAFLYKNSVIKSIKESENSQFVLMNVLINKVNAFKFASLFPNVKVSSC
jgi:GTP-binding protein HflX